MMTQEEKDPCLNLNDLEQKLDEALKKETPESLNEFLDSKRNQGGWIKVSDRLPEEGIYCLVVVYRNNIQVVEIAYFIKEFFGHYGGDVTHWQPLPEPPKD